jgi:hypothetical protein
MSIRFHSLYNLFKQFTQLYLEFILIMILQITIVRYVYV